MKIAGATVERKNDPPDRERSMQEAARGHLPCRIGDDPATATASLDSPISEEHDIYHEGEALTAYKTLPAFERFGVIGRHEPHHVKGERIYLEWAAGERTNPFNWATRKKWAVLILAASFTIIASYAAGAYTATLNGMIQTFGHSREFWLVGLTLFTAGFAIAPMILAPFSELQGRTRVYLVTLFCYICANILSAAAPNPAAVMIGRFLAGVSGSTGSTLVGGTVSDLFSSNDRGIPMALFAYIALFGTSMGPLVSGFVAASNNFPGGQADAWRWVTWLQVIVAAGYFVALLLLLPETRGSVLLSRRAAKLRKELRDERIWAPSDDERTSIAVMLRISITRPFYLLLCEPVVTFMSLWVAFAWGLLYLLLEAVPLVFGTNHAFTSSQIGLVFITVAIGSGIGFAFQPLQDHLYTTDARRRGGRARPEARLYLSMAGGIVFAIGLLIFAWTSFPFVPWIAPCIGIIVTFAGLFQIYLTVFLILSDAYGRYASSALAAQGFARNVFGAGFPLFADPLFASVGYQWAGTILGLIGLLLAIIPFVIYRYGPQIRGKSKFAGQLLREELELDLFRKGAASSGVPPLGKEL